MRCRLGTLGGSSATAATVRWVNCYDRRSRATTMPTVHRTCGLVNRQRNRLSRSTRYSSPYGEHYGVTNIPVRAKVGCKILHIHPAPLDVDLHHAAWTPSE